MKPRVETIVGGGTGRRSTRIDALRFKPRRPSKRVAEGRFGKVRDE